MKDKSAYGIPVGEALLSKEEKMSYELGQQ